MSARVRRVTTPAIDRLAIDRLAIDRLEWNNTAFQPDRPHAAPLETWMARLYTRACEERTLSGDLGVWPEELGDYLANLCRCYTPELVDDAPVEPARITLAPGLLAPYVSADARASFPLCPQRVPGAGDKPVCALIFSGGKDSMAAGLLAEQQGYAVVAYHITKVNHSYPHERDAVQRIAAACGWPLWLLTPRHVPRALGNNVVKNQYCIALVADLCAQMGVYPAVFACGNFLTDDCYATSWYGDMQVAFKTFNTALQGAYAGAYAGATGSSAVSAPTAPRIHTFLDDVLQAVSVWWERAPAEAKAHTASCMMPARNKVQHRRRALAQGIPLMSQYDCAYCEKCKLRAVLLADVVGVPRDVAPYPEDYLIKARAWLRAAFRGQSWCHTHPALEMTRDDLMAALTRRYGAREATVFYHERGVTWHQPYTIDVVFNGCLGKVKRSAQDDVQFPAREPIITHL